jgi:hypothetical protein
MTARTVINTHEPLNGSRARLAHPATPGTHSYRAAIR